MNHKFYQEAIRANLAQRAGSSPDASTFAKVTISTLSQMVDLLAHVIGTRGVNVVLRRSLYVTSIACPWLVSCEEQGDNSPAALLEFIKERLATRDPDVASETGYTLLVNFAELLTTLIGESLTLHLLNPVWASRSPSPEQESKS